MDGINSLATGLGVALTAHNLACAFAGCLLGTLSGVLPGLGAAAAIAMLLPWVHALDATPALIVLAGVFCGVQHGGGIRAILAQVPGTSPSAVTALEGHPMAWWPMNAAHETPAIDRIYVSTDDPAIVEIARGVKLSKGSAFSPARGLDAYFDAYSQARRNKSP